MFDRRLVRCIPILGWTLAACGGDAVIAADWQDGGQATGAGGANSGSAGSGPSPTGSGGSSLPFDGGVGGAATGGPTGSGGAGTGGAGTGGAGTGGTNGTGGAGGASGSGQCVQNADCPNQGLCGYLQSDACSAKGKCFPSPGLTCNAFSPGCACDGTVVNLICNGLSSGYAPKPVRHAGTCTTSDPDGGTSTPDTGTDPACPASFSAASGQTCSQEGQDCTYATGNCICGNTSPRTQLPRWNCYMPAAGCPEPAPSVGASCLEPGLRCDYGFCAGSVILDCTNGSWQKGPPVPCPG